MSRIIRTISMSVALVTAVAACSNGANGGSEASSSHRTKNAALTDRLSLLVIEGCEFTYADRTLQFCRNAKSINFRFYAPKVATSGVQNVVASDAAGMPGIKIAPPAGTTYMHTAINFVDGTRIANFKIPMPASVVAELNAPTTTPAPITTTTARRITTTTSSTTSTTTIKSPVSTPQMSQCYVAAATNALSFCKRVRTVAYTFYAGTKAVSGSLSNTFPNGALGVNWTVPSGATDAQISATFEDGTMVSNVRVSINGPKVDLAVPA